MSELGGCVWERMCVGERENVSVCSSGSGKMCVQECVHVRLCATENRSV